MKDPRSASDSTPKFNNSTELSKYIWTLKTTIVNNGKMENTRKGFIILNEMKRCNLCNLEKYFIICEKNKTSLNQKCGLINSCRQFSKFLLTNHPT